eukprot:6192231-Pleurochrysis_carterae.AAC.2
MALSVVASLLLAAIAAAVGAAYGSYFASLRPSYGAPSLARRECYRCTADSSAHQASDFGEIRTMTSYFQSSQQHQFEIPHMSRRDIIEDATPSHDNDRVASKHDAAYQSLLARVYPLHASARPWQDLQLDSYDIILVTGPQRSGTTWVACALASSLNYTLFDERHPITGGNDTLRALQRTFGYLRLHKQRAVIQSPMATQILHLLPTWPGLLVMFLARNCLDVFRSQNKIDKALGGWTCECCGETSHGGL